MLFLEHIKLFPDIMYTYTPGYFSVFVNFL